MEPPVERIAAIRGPLLTGAAVATVADNAEEVQKPAPAVRQRKLSGLVYDEALRLGYTPLQSRILAGRLDTTDEVAGIAGAVRDIDPPDTLPDIEAATRAIADAILDPSRILAPVTDHDCDGSASAFVLKTALIDYFQVPRERVMPFVTHRLKEGYGVSDKFVERMLAECPRGALCITADQGSTDESRIARLQAEKEIQTVVTDHHGLPAEGPPKSAIACVNPARADSKYDPFVAGCAVAWLVMCSVRRELIERGHLPPGAPSLAPLLDVVAVGTCADAVSLGRSKNNRAILRYGLRRMNAEPARMCWAAMRKVMGKEGPFVTRDISHGIAPRINARGRIDDAMAAIDMLCSSDETEAANLAAVLDENNRLRREIQDEMTGPALADAARQSAQGAAALIVYLEHGHSGVHGIVASRLVETFGRPACCLSPKEGAHGQLTGSLRSVPKVNIRGALVDVEKHHPGLQTHFGGHRGAAGTGIALADLATFREALCAAVARQADPSTLAPVVLTDGPITSPLTISAVAEIEALEPYGREFEPPQFCDQFIVSEARPVGDGSHLKLKLIDPDGQEQSGIWFRAVRPGAMPPVGEGESVRLVYTLALNHWRGTDRLDLHVVGLG